MKPTAYFSIIATLIFCVITGAASYGYDINHPAYGLMVIVAILFIVLSIVINHNDTNYYERRIIDLEGQRDDLLESVDKTVYHIDTMKLFNHVHSLFVSLSKKYSIKDYEVDNYDTHLAVSFKHFDRTIHLLFHSDECFIINVFLNDVEVMNTEGKGVVILEEYLNNAFSI